MQSYHRVWFYCVKVQPKTNVLLCSLCPKLEQYEREFVESDMWQKHYNEITKPLLDEVQKALGLDYNLSESPFNYICLLFSIQ